MSSLAGLKLLNSELKIIIPFVPGNCSLFSIVVLKVAQILLSNDNIEIIHTKRMQRYDGFN